MSEAFRIGWFGGPAEKRVRRERPVAIDFDALDPSAYPEPLVRSARAAWTYGAYQEYCSAASFASLQSALLEQPLGPHSPAEATLTPAMAAMQPLP